MTHVYIEVDFWTMFWGWGIVCTLTVGVIFNGILR